jgi:hypothetical protein
MSKRSLAVLADTVVLALPIASQAGRARTDSGEYNTVTVNLDETEPAANGHFTNGVTFMPLPKERFISVVVEDRSGLPTRALVIQETETDGEPNYLLKEEICGQSVGPIEITRGVDVTVLTQEGFCEDGTQAVATFGTVTATFTR